MSSRASALEAIVSNDYIDLLNSLPIVKLLHAKWERGARGHYFGQLALFCACLVFHALLCQHRRQGIIDSFWHDHREPVLKERIQSAAMCKGMFSVALDNGTEIEALVRELDSLLTFKYLAEYFLTFSFFLKYFLFLWVSNIRGLSLLNRAMDRTTATMRTRSMRATRTT